MGSDLYMENSGGRAGYEAARKAEAERNRLKKGFEEFLDEVNHHMVQTGSEALNNSIYHAKILVNATEPEVMRQYSVTVVGEDQNRTISITYDKISAKDDTEAARYCIRQAKSNYGLHLDWRTEKAERES